MGPIAFTPTIDDDGTREVLSSLPLLKGLKPIPASEADSYTRTADEVFEFVAEADSKGKVLAFGKRLARAGVCLAASYAGQHAMALIIGAAGGPVPLILTVVLTSASMLAR